MIPAGWQEYRREDDDEVIGYIAESDDRFEALTVFGHTLGVASDASDAERMLEEAGLRYLAERWLLTLEDREEPIAVQLVEATPRRLTVQNVDLGYEGDWGEKFTLPVPVPDGILRPERRLI